MKKIHIFLIILVFLFLAHGVSATVGGPTFIYNFKYNPINESVYYINTDLSGRGCPPELMKLSLNFGKPEAVYSCDEGEKLMANNGYDVSLVSTEIAKITNGFKDLTPINLKNNKISIDVSFVDYENIGPENIEIKKANFVASVYQDNKKIIDLPVGGCNLEQPFIFAGYTIPGFDKKIVLLLSTKGDCYEGGYVYETLYVVGVNNLDKTYSNFYKGSSALVPNEGTLVVFESENINNKTEEVNGSKSPIETSNSNVVLYIIFGAALVLGAGYILGKKSGK